MNTLAYRSPVSWLSTLQISILASVVLPLTLISALGVSYFVSVTSRLEEERLKEELALLARAVRLPIGQSLEQGEISDIQNALVSVFEIGRVYGASIYNVNGDRIASAGIADSDLVNSRVMAETVATGEMQEDYREVEGLDVFSQFLPVVDTGGRINGLVQITRRKSDIDSALQDLRSTAWTTWLVLVIVMTLVVVLGHYGSVGRYVRRLLDGMARVEHGERSRRVEPAGPRELARIAEALNRMLDGIERVEAQVNAHREKEKKLSEQLRDQEKMAAIGRVASGISHELGAPLSVIDGRARRLKRYVQGEEEGERQIRGIQQQVRRLNRAVRQLLDYCRPDAMGHSEVDLARVVREAVDALLPELSESRRDTVPEFEVLVDEDLPAVHGDPRRLELALVNLLRNAAQAQASRITVRLQREGDGVKLSIQDDGEGLSDAPEKLQEPFYTTKLPGQGTGLGLAIVRSVATEHQAELTIGPGFTAENGAGERGCRVELVLPPTLDEETGLQADGTGPDR